MEISLLEGNSSTQDSYTTESGNIENKYMLMPEKHLSYFYDIANVGRKTGKRRKSVEKDADGMDNISDFFGEDESEDESDDPEDKDDLDTLDGYDDTTDGIEDSTIISEKVEKNLVNTEKNDGIEIYESNIIKNNKKIKNNNKEISISLDEAVERLQKIIQETPSKSKIDMTPVLNSVLKASKLNNENDSLYSYESLQEAKLIKKLSRENNEENFNLVNSITHDKIYEYDEDIKDASSDGINEINNNENDDVFETESSSDDEIVIDVSNDKRKLSNKYKSRGKYKNSDTETELDLHYSSNSDSDSDEAYEYESADSEISSYNINDDKKNERNDDDVNDNEKSLYPEYQNIQSFTNRRKSSRIATRKFIRTKENNENLLSNTINGNTTIDNPINDFNSLDQDIEYDNYDNNEESVTNKSTSDMSITKESFEVIKNASEVEINKNNKEVNKSKKSNSKSKFNKDNENDSSDDDNDFVNNNFNINSKIDISHDIPENDISDNIPIDIPDNIPDDVSNDIPNNQSNSILDNEIEPDTNNIDDYNNDIDNLSDKSDKENINDKEINIQINIPILKSKSSKNKKGKGKYNSSSSSNNKRKRDEEEVPLRKSSRKRIPPCKYWEGERPEDLLVLNEEQIKERQLKREEELEKQNQWMRRKKRRTRRTIKKEEESVKNSKVEMVNSATSPIKELSNPNEIDISKSLSRDFKTEITTYNIYTKKELKRKLVATQKMLNPQPVNNSTYKFTKIFSEDLTFATGLLLFPKGSSKPNRNSKDNII